MKTRLTTFLLLMFALTLTSFAQSSQSRKNPNAAVNNPDKPLKILSQPDPELTDDQKSQISENPETIKLRVEFLESGYIGAITPLNSLPHGLTEAAIAAAAQIQFEPERKNTKKITVYQVVEYSFKNETRAIENVDPENIAKAENIIKKVISVLGGQTYLQVKTHIGQGKFSQMRDGRNLSFQSFTDAIIYPDKEYTEFKERGIKTIQSNFGETGWYFDGAVEKLSDQTEIQIKGFKRAMRTNIDNFLRGAWRTENASLSYVERRPASLGKRNDVLKLTFDDGFTVEFEFSDEGFPTKTLYSSIGADKRELVESDVFAQFREIQGIKTPFIIDHFSDGVRVSRINYESVDFNKTIPDSIFQKPGISIKV